MVMHRCAFCQRAHSGPCPKRRKSARERGYDAVWERFRLVFLAETPLCGDCLATGRTTAATDVHHLHKLADGGRRLDRLNCVALCHACHSVRTRRGE